ncbi:hypothetical protein HN51_047627, partial [Arachis hypogaea]
MKRCFMDEFVQNSLIDMYLKCGFADLAYLVFDKITEKSIVTWNCMISGLSQNGFSVAALKLFDQMYFTLVDMYAKSGDLQTDKRVFDIMPEKSVVSWSTMIAAYGIHGQMIAAGSLLTKMVESGIRPNEVTFMNILSACRHARSMEARKFYFNSMRDYGIEPNIEHFASIVDLLSRTGDLDEAHRIIKSMLFPVDSSIWGALLNGCQIHGRKDLIRQINNDLQEISTDDTGYYTLLSNIYAKGGYLHESRAVRTKMEGMGLKKVPGYSTIEVDRKIYRFGAGNASESKEIYMFEEYLRSSGQLCDVEGYNSIFSEDYNIKSLRRKASYRAVIVGMDPVCCESTSWMENAQVKKLSRGSTQPFYQ